MHGVGVCLGPPPEDIAEPLAADNSLQFQPFPRLAIVIGCEPTLEPGHAIFAIIVWRRPERLALPIEHAIDHYRPGVVGPPFLGGLGQRVKWMDAVHGHMAEFVAHAVKAVETDPWNGPGKQLFA